MHRSRVVFWLGEASPHQSGYLRALAKLLPETRLLAVFQQSLQRERVALGWREPDVGMDVLTSPNAATMRQIVALEPDNTVHVFGGLRLPMVRGALKLCAPTRALIGVISETRHTGGWRGKLRVLHSHLVERPYRNRIDLVLAIGHSGVRWFLQCGYPEERIFAWAYVVEKPDTMHMADAPRSAGQPEICYVGRCVRGKGIDDLLHALAGQERPWRLHIVGDGPQRRALGRLARALAIDEHVRFHGIRPNAEVWAMLKQADLLVFPSKIDGWGAVVNEALMSGTPVICSDYCGAADLVRGSGHGDTFAAGSVDDLSRVLRAWLSRGRLPEARRAEIRNWSKRIEGEAVGRYFVEVIEHVDEGHRKPAAPWLADASDPAPCSRGGAKA